MHNRERIFCTVLKLMLQRHSNSGKLNLNDVLFTYEEFTKTYNSMGFDHPLRKNAFRNFLQEHGSKKETCKFLTAGLSDEIYGYYRLAAPGEGVDYAPEMLLPGQVLEALAPFDPRQIKTFLIKYYKWVEKTTAANVQNDISGLSPVQAAWLSAAIFSYNIYFHSNPDKISSYELKQSQVSRLAFNLNSENKISSCRSAAARRAVKGLGKHNYLSKCGRGRCRLTFLRESDQCIPSIKINGKVATVNGLKSVKSIIKFVRKEYNLFYFPTNEQYIALRDAKLGDKANIKIDDALIRRTQGSLLDYLLNTYCLETKDFPEFMNIYKDAVHRAEVDADEAFIVEDWKGFFDGLLARADVLSEGEGKFRKFKNRGRNAGKYISSLHLQQYDGFEISASVLYVRNISTMQEIDLRNEEELYYYLQKFIVNAEIPSSVKFDQCPELEIGDANPEMQLLQFMVSHAPISRPNLIRLYQNTYGSSKTIINRLLPTIADYYDGEVYSARKNTDAGLHAARETAVRSESYGFLNQVQDGQASLIWKAPEEKKVADTSFYPESYPNAAFYNRVKRDFIDSTLVYQVAVSDEEYPLLCEMFRTKFKQMFRQRGKNFYDILVTVALVQIAIREYDGNFWKHVKEVLEIDSLPGSRQKWLGEIATRTLRVYGKPYFSENEYATNILLHAFITDHFANSYFEFLFQYYTVDMKRSLSEDCITEAEFICDCMKNPAAKRQQFLSDYVGLSVLAVREYCVRIVAESLSLIDQSFWGEFSGEAHLPQRLFDRFILWQEYSSLYRDQKNKLSGVRGAKLYRKPHLVCDFVTAAFRIVLPEQMLQMSGMEDSEIEWHIISPIGELKKPCNVIEGYTGNKTAELELKIEREEAFLEHRFELVDGGKILRTFIWSNRNFNLFDEEGHWVNCENVAPGQYYGYSRPEIKITSTAIEDYYEQKGLVFYLLNLQEGDLLQVGGEANYYIGELPETGISDEDKVNGVYLEKDREKIPVYRKLPALIIEAEDDRLAGTALIVNGKVNHLAEEQFVRVTRGRTEGIRYYYLDISGVSGIRNGLNDVIVDIPGSRRKIRAEFALLPGFEFQFEDAPYIFKFRGTLRVNCCIDRTGRMTYGKEEGEPYSFSFEEMKGSDLRLPFTCGDNEYLICFEVPVFRYGWTKEELSYLLPDDIWYSDWKDILYVQYPYPSFELSIDDMRFRYDRRADGYTLCDLTKLRSYIDRKKVVNIVSILNGDAEEPFLRIVTRSVLQDVNLSADYENDRLVGTVEIVGKNQYFVDILCDGKTVAEKIPVNGRSFIVDVPLKTAAYEVDVYELGESESDFDEGEYELVGKKTVELINADNLTGSRMEVVSLVQVSRSKVVQKLPINEKYRYYIFLDRKIDRHEYTGRMIAAFHQTEIKEVSDVKVTLADLNDISSITAMVQDDDEYMEFLYDNYSHTIAREENRKLSASERYRRFYPVLYTDDDTESYIWHVLYVKEDAELEKASDAFVPEKREPRVAGDIWVQIVSTDL